MKKLICILIVVLMIVCLLGCSEQTVTASIANSGSFDVTPEATISSSTSFELEKVGRCVINSYDSIDYYRDTTTDVMYMCFMGRRKAGLTEMHDPETGLPLTYTRYMEIYNNLELKE